MARRTSARDFGDDPSIEQVIRGNNHEVAHKRSFEVEVGHEGIDGMVDGHIDKLEWQIASGMNHTKKQELAGWKAQRINIKEED